MKPIAWMLMAACLALTVCGGDEVATNDGASLSTPATLQASLYTPGS
ncbi:hypothetical protein [Burkholderia stagnalis]|nr:hypothetical protein [Burkholderia stagnalis]